MHNEIWLVLLSSLLCACTTSEMEHSLAHLKLLQMNNYCTAVCVQQGHSSCSLCILLIGFWTVWLWGFSWSLPGTLRRQSREGSTWVLAKENAGSPPDPQPVTEHKFWLWPQSSLCMEPHIEHMYTHTSINTTPPTSFFSFLSFSSFFSLHPYSYQSISLTSGMMSSGSNNYYNNFSTVTFSLYSWQRSAQLRRPLCTLEY